MLLVVDVHYKATYTKAVGVLFDWKDETPKHIITDKIKDVADYEPGQFYKRKLPCILQLLQQIDIKAIETIIIDGHVYIDNNKTFGLGGYL